MNLHEYQAKQLFRQYKLPVPAGIVCFTPAEIDTAFQHLNGETLAVKCQVHAGGRGKAGGVKLVRHPADALEFARRWLGNRLVTAQTDAKGQPVNAVYLEETCQIQQELYLSAVIDRSSQQILFMASAAGGTDIEKLAQNRPHFLHKIGVDPLLGGQAYQGRELAFQLGLSGDLNRQFCRIFEQATKLFIEKDLSLLEINPLVITAQGELQCLDAKITVDDNALFRQPDLAALRDFSQNDPREADAEQDQLNYVALDGNIGCMVNGAGLAMGTMDTVKLCGGQPANFLDVGGGATKERVAKAFKLILTDPAVRAVLVNIFGGIVRCDLIADGILAAIADVGVKVPVVVRLEGTHAEAGRRILAESGLNIIAADNLQQAAEAVVRAAKGEI